METTKKTLKISFSTQKGGVGKSTMTTLLASVLHYRLGAGDGLRLSATQPDQYA